jgi:hypothetical protein
MPITESESKPQRRFAPNDLIGFLRKTDRHQIGMVIGIVGIASMAKNWELAGDYSVEIWFRIEKDSSGYPRSKEWEQLLARPLMAGDDCFLIESIPFFLKNISRGDVIRAKVLARSDVGEGEAFHFDRVLDRGGHNTYRLLLRTRHPDDPGYTTSELIRKGLAVEEEHGDFLAVDVPPTVDQRAVDEYLIAEKNSGRWELQDGYLAMCEQD